MDKKETLDTVIEQIQDPSVKMVAKQSLKVAKQALDIGQHSRIQYVVDEIRKIFPKALKKRTGNAD